MFGIYTNQMMPCRHSCFAPICPVVAVPEVLFVKPKGFQQISEFTKKDIHEIFWVKFHRACRGSSFYLANCNVDNGMRYWGWRGLVGEGLREVGGWGVMMM